MPKQFNPKEPASRRNLGAAFRSKLAEIDLNPQRHRPGRISEEMAEQIDDLRDRAAPRTPATPAPTASRTPGRPSGRCGWSGRTSAPSSGCRRGPTRSPPSSTRSARCSARSAISAARPATTVTREGRMLARIYAELDLVAAECIRSGVFDDLTPPQLAAVLASLVYESRRSDDQLAQAADAGRRQRGGDDPRCAGSGARCRWWSGTTGCRAGRSPTSASASRRTAGRPAGRSAVVLADGAPDGRRLRPLGASGARLRRPGGRRRRSRSGPRDRPRRGPGHATRGGGVLAGRPRSRTRSPRPDRSGE